jgi:hypothetical protein
MASTGDRPYDPYIPSEPAAGGAGAQPAPGNQRTAALQAVSEFFLSQAIDLSPERLPIDGFGSVVTFGKPYAFAPRYNTKQTGISEAIGFGNPEAQEMRYCCLPIELRWNYDGEGLQGWFEFLHCCHA